VIPIVRGNNEESESFLGTSPTGAAFCRRSRGDTLELKDGRVLKGKYLGGTQAVLRFEINGEVQTFNTTDAVALTFTGNFRSTDPAMAPAAIAPVAANSLAPTPPGGGRHHPRRAISPRAHDRRRGLLKEPRRDVFHASLETDLTVGNTIVARKGTDVYGRLANAQKSGNIYGQVGVTAGTNAHGD